MLEKTRLLIQQRQNEFSESYQKFTRLSMSNQTDFFSSTLNILKKYEQISSDLYRLRAELPKTDPLRQRTEDFVAHFSHELLGLQKIKKDTTQKIPFTHQYRQIWRENFSLFLFTLFLFVGSIFLGWHITMQEPGNASVFLGDHMLENIFEHNRWFSQINDSPLLAGLLIAWNNIRVAINCFLFGALLGIGGIYILSYNGMMVGSVLAFCRIHQFDQVLLDFIVGHGTLELTLIIASAFASFLIGRVFYQRPYKKFKARMSEALRQSKIVLLGIIPWFVLAAIVEAFISPQDAIPFVYKVIVSLVLAAIFWIWTLWPTPQESK